MARSGKIDRVTNNAVSLPILLPPQVVSSLMYRVFFALLFLIGSLLTNNSGLWAQPQASFRVMTPPTQPGFSVEETGGPAQIHIGDGQQRHSPDNSVWFSGQITPIPIYQEAPLIRESPTPHTTLDTRQVQYAQQNSGLGDSVDDVRALQESYQFSYWDPHAVFDSYANYVNQWTGPIYKLKSAQLTANWVSGSGDNLGMTDYRISGKYSFSPMPLLSFSPNFGMILLNGPQQTDLPGSLYRASLDINWMQPINKKWIAQFAVSPGINSDFDNTSSDAFRITGRALAFYQHSPKLQIALGVVYLDREDISLLPAAGLIWSPSDDWRLEFMFPRPRILHRLQKLGDGETWAYLAGQFGGGSYAIRRSSGAEDVVTIGDFRLVGGLEWDRGKKRKIFAEAGYVFGRDVEYLSGVGNYNPDDAFMIGAGISF